jgi:hypothetical protein
MAGGKREGAGRKKGVPNKLSGTVKQMVLGALEKAGGEQYLLEQSKSNPTAFMTLVGKVLPTEIANADNGDGPIPFVISTPKALSEAEWVKNIKS